MEWSHEDEDVRPLADSWSYEMERWGDYQVDPRTTLRALKHTDAESEVG